MATRTHHVLSDLDRVTCPVCLQIYEEPHQIPCSHIYCRSCLESLPGEDEDDEDDEPMARCRCPLCQAIFDPSSAVSATETEGMLQHCRAVCEGCSRRIRVSKLRKHMESCKKVQAPDTVFHPVAKTSQSYPVDAPNRMTFKCPYCTVRNLDLSGLRKHCNDHHKNSPDQVVCPVCSSMPWGNQDQTSTNFLEHLNLRHKFDYSTYVDYEQDDDEQLQAALRASVQDH